MYVFIYVYMYAYLYAGAQEVDLRQGENGIADTGGWRHKEMGSRALRISTKVQLEWGTSPRALKERWRTMAQHNFSCAVQRTKSQEFKGSKGHDI